MFYTVKISYKNKEVKNLRIETRDFDEALDYARNQLSKMKGDFFKILDWDKEIIETGGWKNTKKNLKINQQN